MSTLVNFGTLLDSFEVQTIIHLKNVKSMEWMFFSFAIIALLLVLLLYRNGRHRYNQYMHDQDWDFNRSPYTQYPQYPQLPPQAPSPWNWWGGQQMPPQGLPPQNYIQQDPYQEYRRERNETDRMLGIILGVVIGIGVLAIFFKGQFQYVNPTTKPVVNKDTIWIGQKDVDEAEVEEPSAKVTGRSIAEISPQTDPNDPNLLPKYIIRLGTFKNIENVARLKEDFSRRFPDLEVDVEPIETTAGWGQRVSIGTFVSAYEANNFKNRWGRDEDWMVLKEL